MDILLRAALEDLAGEARIEVNTDDVISLSRGIVAWAPGMQQQTPIPEFDLEKAFWQQIKASAAKAGFPPEYTMNDWVSDVCSYLEGLSKEQSVTADKPEKRKVAAHLHHGRAEKARSHFGRLDTAARDEVAVGLSGHKAGKGKIAKTLGFEFL